MLKNTKPFQYLANQITGELRYDFKATDASKIVLLYWSNLGLGVSCKCEPDLNYDRLNRILNER